MAAALGEKIRQRLADMGKRPADLARELDRTPQAVNGWLKTGRIDKANLPAIAKFLGVTIEWLVDGSGEAVGAPDIGPFVRFEHLDISASAGNGLVNRDFPEVVRVIEVREAEAMRLVGKRGSKFAKIINVGGDSMTPTISPTDLLFVDPSISGFEGDGIYVFVYDGALHLKRLQQRARGTIAVISDNTNYREWLIEPDDPTPWKVVARVLRALPMNAKDFA